jgi:hypothetical protein
MIYLECALKKPGSLRTGDVIAEVEDKDDRRQQLEIELNFLVKRGDRYFLPVWGLTQDHETKLVQVELPQESVSGTNRIWVRADQVFFQNQEARV